MGPYLIEAVAWGGGAPRASQAATRGWWCVEVMGEQVDFAGFSWGGEGGADGAALSRDGADSAGWSEEAKEGAARSVSGGPTSYLAHFNRGRRPSVCAEPYTPGEHVSFPRTAVPKDAAAVERIRTAVASNMLFRNLDEAQLAEVVSVMVERAVPAGEDVIVEGEEGDYFYVIDSGAFDVYRSGEAGGAPVVRLGPGETFGELALMYNSPRMATVRAAMPSTVWAVDRSTFRGIVIDLSFRKRRTYEAFLRAVPLLAPLRGDEINRICDALQPATFADGEAIIREGEAGSNFYIIEEGRAAVTIAARPPAAAAAAAASVEVNVLGRGGYFGELALLWDAPRAATVTAVGGPVRCLSLSKADFIRLLGPVMDIMKRNQEHYRKYEEYL